MRISDWSSDVCSSDPVTSPPLRGREDRDERPGKMIKLYGTPPTRALRAMWLLNELDLAHEIIPVDLHAGEPLTPEFPALNPAAQLPVLVDGDLVLPESRSEERRVGEGGGREVGSGGWPR